MQVVGAAEAWVRPPRANGGRRDNSRRVAASAHGIAQGRLGTGQPGRATHKAQALAVWEGATDGQASNTVRDLRRRAHRER